jgi:hypothetical protein
MDCLGCNYIETAPVTLRDGRVVCSSCQAWRLECEARHVLALPHRRAYLDEIRAKRGVEAYHDLRNEMLSLQEASRRAVDPSLEDFA